MTRTQRNRRALVGVAVLGVSCLAATTGATLAQGAPASHHAKTAARSAPAVVPGSGLGAVEVTASSAAMTVPIYSHNAEDVQASIPYSFATLGTGGIGSSLTSAFWPGATGAHGGDALNLLGVKGLPTSVAQDFNYPEFAEAQTGVGDPTVSNSHPGLTMKATATATHLNANSSAGGSGIPAVGPIVGNTASTTDIRLSGAKNVLVSATSSIHHISIAKVVTIDSVTTIAHAVTNGHSASGTSKTIVSGVKIAGVPVTVDNKGVHVSSAKKLPIPLLGQTASAVVNKALKSSGISLTLTKVKQNVHRAHVTIKSGALIVKLGNAGYKSQANDTNTLVTIGGASIDAIASPGFPQPKIKPVQPPPSTPNTSGTGPVTKTIPGTPGTAGTAGTPGGGTLPAAGTAPVTASAPQLAADPISLPKGLALVWVLVALAAAGLVGFGMRRLPDQVLQATGSACRLEEST